MSGKNLLPVYEGVIDTKQLMDEFVKVQLDTGMYGWCCSKLIKKTRIQDSMFDPKLKLAEDFDFFLNIYEKVNSICF